jgi:hypothetical protein
LPPSDNDHVPGTERARVVDHLIRYLDEFYEDVTIA